MKLSYLSRPLAILALTALAACGGGSSGPGPHVNAPQPIVTPAGGTPLVGIGDSLTAGYQSSGFLGQANPLVTYSGSAYPGHAVPPGQENGFWADIYVQLTGVPAASMYVPANRRSLSAHRRRSASARSSSLNNATLFANTQCSCAQHSISSLLEYGDWAATPIEPDYAKRRSRRSGHHDARSNRDDRSAHRTAEHINARPGRAATARSRTIRPRAACNRWYPAKASCSIRSWVVISIRRYRNLTELNVAVALQPKLATVWLGANDVFKFSFSGGNPVASDSPTQMQADLTQIMKALTAKGTKVLIADLPTCSLRRSSFRRAIVWSPISQRC